MELANRVLINEPTHVLGKKPMILLRGQSGLRPQKTEDDQDNEVEEGDEEERRRRSL